VDNSEVVCRCRTTSQLDFAIVLIAPEPRHWIEDRSRFTTHFGEESASSRLSALDRVFPVFDSQHLAETFARIPSDVAGRGNAGSGEERVVAHDPVFKIQTRSIKPLGVNGNSDADYNHLGRNHCPVGECHANYAR
jgi:hypothetical protein